MRLSASADCGCRPLSAFPCHRFSPYLVIAGSESMTFANFCPTQGDRFVTERLHVGGAQHGIVLAAGILRHARSAQFLNRWNHGICYLSLSA